jgi:hypothetical protein
MVECRSSKVTAKWLFHGLNHLLHLFHRAEADTKAKDALVVLKLGAPLFSRGGVPTSEWGLYDCS